MYILGISAFYHDSAATLLYDGDIIAAAQEERFTRKKHDSSFPRAAIAYCLAEAKIKITDVQSIVFYDKPLVKFERLLETYLAFAPRGITSFMKSMPVWIKEKLFLKKLLRSELAALGGVKKQLPEILFTDHHQAHAASAFFPSPFERAGVLCMDGVGEWATTSVWLGDGATMKLQWSIDFPHSLGLLYSAFTYYTGFTVNSGEYKLMGLAPYGTPRYVGTILDNLIDIKEDGTFRLNMDYFDYPTGLTMINDRFSKLFGGKPRQPETPLSQRDMDIAASIQAVTETVVFRLAKTVRNELDVEYLCLAGGVALNCVANGRLLKTGLFRDIWIQPAAGDAGGSLGAAFAAWHNYYFKERVVDTKNDKMNGAYLGPSFSDAQIQSYLDSIDAVYTQIPSKEELCTTAAQLLAAGNVIGWFNGRMEFGPRALGARSILGDPRSQTMQSTMNLKIKYRESFRPFAPAVLAENVAEYFELDRPSPYMLLVASVNNSLRLPLTEEQEANFGIKKLQVPRSIIPAVTHVDYSARIQTVHQKTNPLFYRLLRAFKEITGCALLVNTSFNVRGEPIVCAPEDAYRCFMRTEMDYLIIGDFLCAKSKQPVSNKEAYKTSDFVLD